MMVMMMMIICTLCRKSKLCSKVLVCRLESGDEMCSASKDNGIVCMMLWLSFN